MANYRPVFVNLWALDDKFQDYSVEGKLLFLYLITNDHVSEAGIYKITPKTISNETDIPRQRVVELLTKELTNNVTFDEENCVVFVHKFLRFNGSGNPANLQKSISNTRKLIKTTLWEHFDKCYARDLKPIKNDSETYSANSNSNTNSNTKNKEPRKSEPCDTRLADLLIAGMLSNDEKAKVPKKGSGEYGKWVDQIRLCREQDGRSEREISAAILFSQSDPFWLSNIHSTAKLRKQLPTLLQQARREKDDNSRPSQAGGAVRCRHCNQTVIRAKKCQNCGEELY